MFDLTDADLRARTHNFMVRLSIPLDRLFDDADRYAALCAGAGRESAEAKKLWAEIEEVLIFLCDRGPEIPQLLTSLSPIARYGFEAFSRLEA
jgi:hypothetical protein